MGEYVYQFNARASSICGEVGYMALLSKRVDALEWRYQVM